MMVNVDKYSSTMEYMGMLFQLFQLKHPMSSHYHKSILTPDLYDYNYHTIYIYIYISHYISHRIHGAAICGVPWIPSTYPLYVSIYIYTSTMGPGDGENLCRGNGITFSAPSHSCALLVVGPDGAGRCLQFINIVYIYIYDIT